MPERTVSHSTFRTERIYDATPAQVFAAFADPAARRRWFIEGEGWEVVSCKLDFRRDASEQSTFRFKGGPLVRNETIYHDIVENERFVCSYTMDVGGDRISASLATVELTPDGAGTRLVYTEQGAHLDGHDNAEQREQGCRELYEALARELERQHRGA